MLFSLSGLKLTLQDLPIRLLSRLRSLERWDLSRNQLQELPQNLDLPALRYLDLSDNQLEDITSLESLQRLEELKMEDNLYITVRELTMEILQHVTVHLRACLLLCYQSQHGLWRLPPSHQISDHYKLMVLLPRLMIFNGKNVSTTATHLRYVYTENLRTRVSISSHFTALRWTCGCFESDFL